MTKKKRTNTTAKAVMTLVWKIYHECTGEHAAKLRYSARRAWTILKKSGLTGVKEEIEKIEHYKRCCEIAACVDRFDMYALDTEKVAHFTIDGTPYELDCKKYDAHDVLTTALKDAGFAYLKTTYGTTYYQKKSAVQDERVKICEKIAENADKITSYEVHVKKIIFFFGDVSEEISKKNFIIPDFLEEAIKKYSFRFELTSYGAKYYKIVTEPTPDTVNGWNLKNLIADGAKRWTKGEHDRVYVSKENCDLELDYYKSGNVCSAAFNGEPISNAMSCRIGVYISLSMYIDLKTGKIVFVNSSKHSFPEEVKEILERKYYEGSENYAKVS